MKKVLPALLLGLAFAACRPGGAYAQSAAYNRWDARPATPVKPRPASVAPPLALRLQRGIGQRLASNRRLPADSLFFRYMGGRIKYPAAALRAGLQGQVSVQLTIAADGTVADAQGAGTRLMPLFGEITPQAKAEAEAQLAEEARRVLSGLLFEPASASTAEILTVNYIIR